MSLLFRDSLPGLCYVLSIALGLVMEEVRKTQNMISNFKHSVAQIEKNRNYKRSIGKHHFAQLGD